MVSKTDIRRYCDSIAATFQPLKIIFFGSCAHGQPNEDSDVDVLVVMPKLRSAYRGMGAKIRMTMDADFPVEVLVRGESEVCGKRTCS